MIDKIKEFFGIDIIKITPVINDAMFDNQNRYHELLNEILNS